MILVDTSVWVAHFRKGGTKLGELLSEALVLVHPFVVCELACGNLRNRGRILSDLEALPSAVSAAHEEVMRLAEDRKLWGLGPKEEGTFRNHVLTWSGHILRAVRYSVIDSGWPGVRNGVEVRLARSYYR
jgi:hypothetical protein